jgi:glycosyltransferase involved in cell wall biosynthesis
MPIKYDTTKFMWILKKLIFSFSRFKIIVASNWMAENIKQSPLLKNKSIEVIPFGINLEVFKPDDKMKCKKELGILENYFVICFRANSGKFKGMDDIIYCLDNLKVNKPICLLTLNERGLVDCFIGKYQIVEMGWVFDERLTAKIYNSCDLFLMPSKAEAFGMMAIEAMCCGKTVVAYDNTSLSEVLNSPDSGITVEYGNKEALLNKVEYLIQNPGELERLGNNANKFAKKNYCFENHQNNIMNIYKSMIYD